ncbi:hypothetical protein AB1K84_08945 [Mesobacillus foraminis]|uniref:hypothetical protein n=1 Tax=Mesobacillus foraminis TaxID=279826 RepID=UPI0039A3CD1D
MRKGIILPLTVLIALLLPAISGVYVLAQAEPLETIYKKEIDITGDGKKDLIEMIGVPFEKGTLFLKEIYVTAKTSEGKNIKIDFEGGYEPSLQIKDLDHDGVKDLFVGVATGGSGGLSNYYLYSLKGSNLSDLTVPDPLTISSTFENNYKATIKLDDVGESYQFNLSNRKKEYDRLGLYHNGKLNEPGELMVFPFSTLKAVKVKGNKAGVKGVQRFSGVSNGDTIGFVESSWYLEDGKWKLINTSVQKTLEKKK